MRLRIPIAGLIAVAGFALAMALVGSPIATANTTSGIYTITACSPSGSTGAFTPINQAPAALTTTNACGGVGAIGPDDAATSSISSSGALFAYDQIGSTTLVPTGSTDGWQLSVPAGIEITGISYYSSYETDGDGWLSGVLVDGAAQSSDCQTNLNQTSPCAYYNNQVPQVLTGLNASSLLFGVECSQVQGGLNCLPNSEGSHAVEAALYSAQVTLERTGGPIVQGEGGPLWAGGVVSGSVPLTFNATDPSGIAEVKVLSGTGASVFSQTQSCTYTQVQACPELSSAQVQVNTQAIGDGPQHLQLMLTNAAGDTTVVQGPTIVIDNDGPPAPSSLSATAASTTSNVIDLAWADPANPPQPLAGGYVELCQSVCGSPVSVGTSGAAQVTAPAAGAYTVRLWLTDTAGQGSQANAATTTVTVPEPTTTTVTTTTTTTTTIRVPTSTPDTVVCKKCPSKKSRCIRKRCPAFIIHSSVWAKGYLTVKLGSFPKHDRLKVTLYYQHARKRTVTVKVSRSQARIKTNRPSRTVLVAVRATKSVRAAFAIDRGS